MNSIDEVVARSRQPGTFSERRQFTVARMQAVEKLRRFALADPHFYILELIQSAVANGASYIDIHCQKEEVGLSYVGGGYGAHDLGQLFDFLFASQQDVAQGDLRLLALGINALMQFEPQLITIESGDGTLEGTTRVVIHGRADSVEVGRPEQALRGTFISAQGLSRRAVAHRSNLEPHQLGPPECTAIEEHCLLAPVPILVNQFPMFGYRRQRTLPQLYGMQRTVSFDEGDLYGTLGLALRPTGAWVRLVTHGVAIQTVTHERFPGIGGVVAHDRLRKTADHAGIVRDDVYEAMWQRLAHHIARLTGHPAAQQAMDRRAMAQAALQLGILDSPWLTVPQALARIHAARGVVLAPLTLGENRLLGPRARQVGQALGFPVAIVAPEDHARLRELLEPGVQIVTLDFTSDQAVAFFQQAPVAQPGPPWLADPVALEPIAIEELAGAMGEQVEGLTPHGTLPENWIRHTCQYLGQPGDRGRLTIFTPSEGRELSDGLAIEVHYAQRLAWKSVVPGAYRGQTLVLELPGLTPQALPWRAVGNSSVCLGEVLARALAQRLAPFLERVRQQTVQSLAHHAVQPGSSAACMLLEALAATGLMRVQGDGTNARHMVWTQEPPLRPELTGQTILSTLDGIGVSLEALRRMASLQGGWVYGAVPEVPPDLHGLDTSRILALDRLTEPLVAAIVGHASYVRVDGRETLAEVDGLVCRDIALGLLPDAGLALQVESGASPQGTVTPGDDVLPQMATQLLGHLLGKSSEAPDAAENRRHALAHLRRLARALHERPKDEELAWLQDAPLFAMVFAPPCSLAQISRVWERGGRVRMLDGRADDQTEAITRALAAWQAQGRPATARALHAVDLAMEPVVFALLTSLGPILGSADVALGIERLGDDRAGHVPTYLQSVKVRGPGIAGMLGLERAMPEHPTIRVASDAGQDLFALDDIARQYGVTGHVHVTTPTILPEVVQTAVHAGARSLIHDLMLALPSHLASADARDGERATGALLHYAGQQFTLVREAGGTIGLRNTCTVAEHILTLPLFPGAQGTPLSALRLLREFQTDIARPGAGAFPTSPWRSASLAPMLPDYLAHWLGQHLDPARIQNLARQERSPAKATSLAPAALHATQDPSPHRALAELIRHWLEQIYDATPELPPLLQPRIIVIQDPDGRPTGRYRHAPFASMHGDRRELHHVRVDANHRLVRQLLAKPGARELAWVLLGVHAVINAALEEVTNAHELAFQRAVWSALADGRLAAAVAALPA